MWQLEINDIGCHRKRIISKKSLKTNVAWGPVNSEYHAVFRPALEPSCINAMMLDITACLTPPFGGYCAVAVTSPGLVAPSEETYSRLL